MSTGYISDLRTTKDTFQIYCPQRIHHINLGAAPPDTPCFQTRLHLYTMVTGLEMAAITHPPHKKNVMIFANRGTVIFFFIKDKFYIWYASVLFIFYKKKMAVVHHAKNHAVFFSRRSLTLATARVFGMIFSPLAQPNA